MISIRKISSFLPDKASTVQENCLKLLTLSVPYCSILPFPHVNFNEGKCILFHAYSTRFRGNHSISIPNWGLGVHLFRYDQVLMRKKGVNQQLRPYCIAFWGKDCHMVMTIRLVEVFHWGWDEIKLSKEWFLIPQFCAFLWLTSTYFLIIIFISNFYCFLRT